MLKIPGSTIMLPAWALETRATRDANAWVGMLLTVELYRAIEVIRLAHGSSRLLGDWFAIEADVRVPETYAAEHAIPRRFNERRTSLTHGAVWRLQPGTILNVGRCGPLFGYPGGGYQAEFLDGPVPRALAVGGV